MLADRFLLLVLLLLRCGCSEPQEPCVECMGWSEIVRDKKGLKGGSVGLNTNLCLGKLAVR